MKILGNIIWMVFGGLSIAIEYLMASFVLMVTIVGIPFGLRTMKLGLVALWPFGTHVESGDGGLATGCMNMFMNILWFFVGGIWICLTHVFFGLLLGITIIGIPWAKMHFRLAGLALLPFGKVII